MIRPRSPSGLGEAHQRAARQVVATGCELLLKNAGEVRYTLHSPLRWQAIDERLRIADGRFLTWGDCSSTATWLLWNGLTHIDPKMPDIVNGKDWKSGWTGTIAEHGTLVKHDHAIKVGDLILYGAPPSYEHVTVALGGGVCFSHGSNPPMKHPIDYRADRGPVRRFI